MIEDFKEVLKKAKPLSEKDAKAKAQSVKDMMSMIKGGIGKDMEEMLGKGTGMSGMKKATIVSNSKEGLKEGAEKLSEALDEKSDKEDKCSVCDKEPCECEHEEAGESKEHEVSESEGKESAEKKVASDLSGMSEEEKIAFLEEQLAELKGKKKNSELDEAKKSIKSIF